MNQGNITFTGVNTVPDTVQGANNGLSINTATSFVVLGQNVGAPGNPALMATNREIPYAGGTVLRITNLSVGGADIQFGGIYAGRTSLQINGGNASVPSLLLNNVSATTNKLWYFEATTVGDPAGRFVLNDNTGNFFIMNRQLASISAPFHMMQKVLNTAVNLAMALVTQRSRHVITNIGAAGNIIITLPAIVATTPQWPEFTFVDIVGTTLTIQAGAGVTIQAGAVVSPAGGTITGNAFATIRLQAISATQWVAIAFTGAWVTP